MFGPQHFLNTQSLIFTPNIFVGLPKIFFGSQKNCLTPKLLSSIAQNFQTYQVNSVLIPFLARIVPYILFQIHLDQIALHYMVYLHHIIQCNLTRKGYNMIIFHPILDPLLWVMSLPAPTLFCWQSTHIFSILDSLSGRWFTEI